MIVFKDTHTFSFFKNEHVPGNRKTRTDKVTKRQSGALRLACPRPRHGRSGKKPPTTHHQFPERQYNPDIIHIYVYQFNKKRYFNHKTRHNISFRYLQKTPSGKTNQRKNTTKSCPKTNAEAFNPKHFGVYHEISRRFPANVRAFSGINHPFFQGLSHPRPRPQAF